jgi:threonine/homoserine/homoserine lactone efflux protein
MDAGMLTRGFVLGFTIAAAVGPIALLVMRRTLAQGVAVGLASGLGVATADAIYGGIAAFGLTAVTDLLVGSSRLLGIAGGAALILIGWRTAGSRPTHAAAATPTGASIARGYATILALTLTNPLTIISFAALFAGFGVSGDAVDAAFLTLGVFAGSAAWWLLLTGAVARLRGRITLRVLRFVNLASGAAIVAFGVVAIGAGIRG